MYNTENLEYETHYAITKKKKKKKKKKEREKKGELFLNRRQQFCFISFVASGRTNIEITSYLLPVLVLQVLTQFML